RDAEGHRVPHRDQLARRVLGNRRRVASRVGYAAHLSAPVRDVVELSVVPHLDADRRRDAGGEARIHGIVGVDPMYPIGAVVREEVLTDVLTWKSRDLGIVKVPPRDRATARGVAVVK